MNIDDYITYETHPSEAAFPYEGYRGLTKREYFAAMAMQGFCANNTPASNNVLAYDSVNMADHLILALNK